MDVEFEIHNCPNFNREVTLIIVWDKVASIGSTKSHSSQYKVVRVECDFASSHICPRESDCRLVESTFSRRR